MSDWLASWWAGRLSCFMAREREEESFIFPGFVPFFSSLKPIQNLLLFLFSTARVFCTYIVFEFIVVTFEGGG